MNVLVTGGSGFIGTNLVESLLADSHSVLSVDRVVPREINHRVCYQRVDILDRGALTTAVKSFAPSHIVHLAARTDLDEHVGLAGYSANTDGVRSLVMALDGMDNVERCVFASTKLVVPNSSGPTHDTDFRPDTVYGQSKVLGEQIVRSARMQYSWCIVRPTSIWGPWSDAPGNPYGRFFKMVMKGLYVHPAGVDPPRYYGYVGNTVFQIRKILEAPASVIHGQVYYLADYEVYRIRAWADMISRQARGRGVVVVPRWLVESAARLGDILKHVGIADPPISSFRLRNMSADTSLLPLENIKALTGPLPYTIEQGVAHTMRWMAAS